MGGSMQLGLPVRVSCAHRPESVAHHVQASRHLVMGQFVAASCAKDVGRSHSSETVAATGGELEVTLRTEVEVALHAGAAGCAACNKRSAQQKVENDADAAGHHETDQHPETSAH